MVAGCAIQENVAFRKRGRVVSAGRWFFLGQRGIRPDSSENFGPSNFSVSLLRLCCWLIGCALTVSGCVTIEGGPARLYTVDQEVAQAQLELPGLLAQYQAATTDPQKMYYRNEYIARRMYIIDVEYSAYEEGLTSERQKFMFGSHVAGQVLNTVAALTPAGTTTRALSGAAGAVSATAGYYDSDLIIAKTIQIVEAQMRGQRDTVAQTILQRRGESSVTYTIGAALSDLEDYYRAGTMNTGLIQAANDATNNAVAAAANKAIVVTFGSNASSETLRACLNQPGALAKVVALTSPRSTGALFALVNSGSPAAAAILAKARAAGICP